MTLRETLQTMKEKNSEKNFNIMVEGMRRRADKGMIDGVSSKEIDEILREMEIAESQPESIIAKEEMISLISELSEAIDKHGYLSEDYCDDIIDDVILHEFYINLISFLDLDAEMLTEGKDIYGRNFKERARDWAEENPRKHRAVIAGAGIAGAGAAVGTVTPFVTSYIKQRKGIKAAGNAYISGIANHNNKVNNLASTIDKYKNNGKVVNVQGTKYYSVNNGQDLMKVSDVAAKGKELKDMGGTKIFNPAEFEAAKEAYKQNNPHLLKKVWDGASKTTKNIGTWLSDHPDIRGGLIGAGLVGGALLARKIYQWRKRKKAEKLTEEYNEENIFSENMISEIRSILFEMDENDRYEFIDSIKSIEELPALNKLITEALSAPIQEEQSLNEAVTYINNNGELKTKSAKEYVEDMHKYDSSTSIEKFDLKKRKNRKYSLLDEDLDSFKKLSEMSLEEILSEAEEI